MQTNRELAFEIRMAVIDANEADTSTASSAGATCSLLLGKDSSLTNPPGTCNRLAMNLLHPSSPNRLELIDNRALQQWVNIAPEIENMLREMRNTIEAQRQAIRKNFSFEMKEVSDPWHYPTTPRKTNDETVLELNLRMSILTSLLSEILGEFSIGISNIEPKDLKEFKDRNERGMFEDGASDLQKSRFQGEGTAKGYMPKPGPFILEAKQGTCCGTQFSGISPQRIQITPTNEKVSIAMVYWDVSHLPVGRYKATAKYVGGISESLHTHKMHVGICQMKHFNKNLSQWPAESQRELELNYNQCRDVILPEFWPTNWEDVATWGEAVLGDFAISGRENEKFVIMILPQGCYYCIHTICLTCVN